MRTSIRCELTGNLARLTVISGPQRHAESDAALTATRRQMGPPGPVTKSKRKKLEIRPRAADIGSFAQQLVVEKRRQKRRHLSQRDFAMATPMCVRSSCEETPSLAFRPQLQAVAKPKHIIRTLLNV